MDRSRERDGAEKEEHGEQHECERVERRPEVRGLADEGQRYQTGRESGQKDCGPPVGLGGRDRTLGLQVVGLGGYERDDRLRIVGELHVEGVSVGHACIIIAGEAPQQTNRARTSERLGGSRAA